MIPNLLTWPDSVVVRARVDARLAQERILAGARARLATWLERGPPAQPLSRSAAQPPRVAEPQVIVADKGRERQR